MFKRILCVTCTLWLVAATTVAQNIPVRNSGFESSSGSGAADWTVVGGTGPGNNSGLDRGVSHAGKSSFSIVHDRAASFAMLSSPVVLEIGKLYGLSGWSFRPEEDDASAAERLHKCSSFLASGPATKDGRIVFGQLFMWNGYTGVHWDILCDLVPAKGHRLVYETFPGGIHSGADFYMNDAGIMIGETTVALRVRQEGTPYTFCTSVVIETAAGKIWRRVNVSDADESFSFRVSEPPLGVRFNCGNDIPVSQKNMYTFSNYFDDFTSGLIVYGTHRHTESNRASALRFQTVLADQFTETFAPVRQDAALADADLSSHDLIVLGGAADNALVARVAPALGIDAGKNFFRWEGKTYGEADDGLFVAMPNPWNSSKAVYLFLGNSALEVYQMTKRFQGLPSWGVWKGDQVTDRGYFSPWYPATGLAPDVTSSLR